MDDSCFLGIDIGSTTIKLAAIDGNMALLYKNYQKHQSSHIDVLVKMLQQLNDFGYNIANINVTGSGKEIIGNLLEVSMINEIIAQATATSVYFPDVRTIFEIGGQDSKFIRIKSNSDGLSILTHRMNDICAAGTGAFIEAEAERSGIDIIEYQKMALQAGNNAQIAGRCAVFAKTDIVHLRQQGADNKSIASGVCYSVVRNYIAQFIQGRKLGTPIAFQGGVAANKAVVNAFMNELKLSPKDFFVPDNYEVTGALGAAICALKQFIRAKEGAIKCNISKCIVKISSHIYNSEMPRQFHDAVGEVRHISIHKDAVANTDSVYLGIDVGSTSTCLVAIDENDNIVYSKYLYNLEMLVNSIETLFQEFKESFAGRNPAVLGLGVTGSGRNFICRYLNADYRINEIVAQSCAGLKLYPDVDTIFEIGGQDSKYIKVNNGTLSNFDMNKVCAAGTGYFLQEQAKQLGIDVSELSNIAQNSKHPCNLGDRCTVFMESDILTYKQQGAEMEDLAAGLCYAVAGNYINKVISGKEIGRNILFLGGVSKNESVAKALSSILRKPVYVPEYNEVSCAYGAAMLTKRHINKQKINTSFDIDLRNSFVIKHFICNSCSNRCQIEKISFGDNDISYRGGICGKYENSRKRTENKLMDERNRLLVAGVSEHNTAKIKVGITRCHLTFEYLPLYTMFFNTLGYSVILSDTTNDKIANYGNEVSVIDNCFASKVMYGHVRNLIDKQVDFIFIPSIVEIERKQKDLERNYACPHIQEIPALIQFAFPDFKFDVIRIQRTNELDWEKEFYKYGTSVLGKNPANVKTAIKQARLSQEQFRRNRAEIMDKKEDKSINVVLLGKPYNIYDGYLNNRIIDIFSQFHITAIPFDMLPFDGISLSGNYQDMVFECGQDILRAAKYISDKKHMYPVFITNYGCGPDSFIIKYLEEIFKDRLFLVLEIDEHSSDVGMVTRIEAFINGIQYSQNKAKHDFDHIIQTYMCSSKYKNLSKLLYVPIGFDSYQAISAAFNSIGIETKMLPRHDEITEYYAKIYSNGKECLPYIMHCGDVVRMTMDNKFTPDNAAIYMPASDLACRVSLFPSSIHLLLKRLGLSQVPVIAPRVSMDKDESMTQFGIKFTRTVFRGMYAVEIFSRLLTQIRPYEVNQGDTEQIYEQSLSEIHKCISNNKDFLPVLKKCVEAFEKIQVKKVKKPVIGLIGDDYTRGNEYANNYFIRKMEKHGCEILTMPIWSTFFEFEMNMKPIKTLKRGKLLEYLFDRAKLYIGQRDIKLINELFEGRVRNFPDASFSEMIFQTEHYFDERSEPLILMALSHANQLTKYGVDGIANLVGFQCMIHSITSGVNMKLFNEKNILYLTLCYDFQRNLHHNNRIEAFTHLVYERWMARNEI